MATSQSPPPSPPLNTTFKSDMEQQNAIKMQQMEAIRLIQISLDKLSTTTAVQMPPKSQPKSTAANSSAPPPSTVLVYKESNLHKNLLVSKILNKAKYFYYQSIVQTMRLSLISKLNYYSSLIQQLNTRSSAVSADETSIVDEMKHLMHQILHETYQFNLNTSASEQITLSDSPAVAVLDEEEASDASAAFRRFQHISVYEDPTTASLGNAYLAYSYVSLAC